MATRELRDSFGLYWRTVRHLHPRQTWWRARLRLQRRAMRLSAVRRLLFKQMPTVVRGTRGWPAGYTPLDRLRFIDDDLASGIARGTFALLGHSVELNDDWQQLDEPQLWRYHLHYWDWAWHVLKAGDIQAAERVLGRFWHGWVGVNEQGLGDAWSPYVVALRTWTLCGLHGAFEDEALRNLLAGEVDRHSTYLAWNIENDVGGNHLIKNLKAMVGAAVFTADDRSLEKWLGALRTQVRVQVLADGGHYERSPAYHAQVLGDLIDIESLLDSSRRTTPLWLRSTVAGMRSWLSSLVGPDGRTPVLNDGATVRSAELRLLGVERIAIPERLVLLESTGIVVAAPAPDVQFVMDVGDPCPDELPAHAHADCLSFELVVGTERIVVDTGTSQYGSGPRRQHERSTRAHNTVTVDGQDQTEVWGSFRAGHRARPSVLGVTTRGETMVIDAEHDGYRRLSGAPMHRRRVELSSDGLTIVDTIRGRGVHHSESALHLAADLPTEQEAEPNAFSFGGSRLVGSSPIHVDAATYATAFGEELPCVRARMSVHGELPHRFSWHLSWASPADSHFPISNPSEEVLP